MTTSVTSHSSHGAHSRPLLSRAGLLVLRANVVAQIGIVLTGGLVRVTSSGLGCPTWPECVPGSITPTSNQTQAWHKYIEFGNRTLTFVITAVAIATVLAIRSYNSSRRAEGLAPRPTLTKLSWSGVAGIFAQAILGGITVLTGLHPLSVAAHFLLSIALITLAVKLLVQAQASDDVPRTLRVSPIVYQATRAQNILGLVVIVIGTLVTGSGPHAGDSAKVTRLPFDPRMISWLHADVVLLFIGLSIGLVIALKATDAPTDIVKAAALTVVIALSQGLIGYVQYFTALPWVLVALHMLGACILWTVTYRQLLTLTKRG